VLFGLLQQIGQAQTLPHDWNVLQRLLYGDKLRVELRNHKSVTGKFAWRGDQSLTLLIGDKTRNITQSDIEKIYLVSAKSVGRTTLRGAVIGASAGAIAGDAVGEDCGRHPSGICLDRKSTIAAGAVVAAIPGAATGAVIGALSHKQQLIYE